MKLIIFQNFNYNYIYFILYFIACLAQEYLDLLFKKRYKSDFKNRGHFYEFISLLINCLSDFLAIIPLNIKKNLTKNKNRTKSYISNDDDTSTKTDNYYLYYNKIADEKKKKMKILNFYTFLSAGLDFLVSALFYLYNLYFKTSYDQNYDFLFNSELAFQIVLQYILSIFILKTHFNKHHYLSILINIIAFIILFALDNINDNFDWGMDLAYFGVLILLVLEKAYGKKAMTFGYISPYTLLILIGIYKNILIFIFLVLFIPIMLSLEENFFNDLNDFDGDKILLLLGGFLFNFLSNLFNWILIDRFSPSHLALSLIVAQLSFNIIYALIYSSEENYEVYDKAGLGIRIILYAILFLAAMIHNEIFIITKWGLGENTKLFLEEKLKEEKLLSNSDTDKDILKKFDTMIAIELEEEKEQDDNDNNNNDEDGKNNKEEKEND